MKKDKKSWFTWKRLLLVSIVFFFSLILIPSLVSATITYNGGTNLITLDDSVGAGDSWTNAYDMDDVLANCGAVVTKQGANAYDVSARMYFADGVYFVSTNEFVELKPNPINPNYAISSHAGSHIRIGEYDAVNEYSYNGAFWRFYTGACTGSNTNKFSGEVLIYGSNLWGDATSYMDGLHWDGKTRIYNSILKIKSYLWNVDTNLQDVKWYGSGGTYTTLYARGFIHAFAGITSINSNYGIFASGTTNADFDVYDVTFQDCTTSYFTSSGNNYLVRLINCPTFVNCNAIASGRPGMKLCFTFNVKVTDNQGTSIVGATVSLKDVDGNDAFSPEQTVSGGVLTADKIVTKYWYRHADQGGNKDYNDYTLKITSGSDETEYKITIDHKISEDVVLLPQAVASYDNIMDTIQNTNPLNLLSITGSFYSPNDEINIYSVTTSRNGTLVNSTVNVNVTYPNGTQLSAGASTQESTGRYKYNFALPSGAPTGTYQIKIDANYSTYESHETLIFLISPVLEDISGVVDYINQTITNTLLPDLQNINQTVHDNYDLLTEINTTTHSVLTNWGSLTAQNLYDLEYQTKNIATYINDTRWNNSVFQDVLDKWSIYTADTLYTVSNQTKTIADYINTTRWDSYLASTLYSESHLARLTADYINNTRWDTKNAQDLYDMSDEIKAIADYINNTRFGSYNVSNILDKWSAHTATELHDILNYINITRWNTYTAQQLYDKSEEARAISSYINTTRWGLYNSSDLYDLSILVQGIADYINNTRWATHNATELYSLVDDLENILITVNSTVTYINASGTGGGGGAFRVELSNFGEINPGTDYKAQLTIFNETGCMVNADSSPLISLYDSSGNAVVTNAPMANVKVGRYSYSYMTSSGQPSGQWMALTLTTISGNTVDNVVYWEMESNPPEVTLVVTDDTITDIKAELSITNEGASSQEYTYYYWITPRVDGNIADADTVDVGSASKLVASLETYTITVTLNLVTLGDYYFKARVYYSPTYSGALQMFTSRKQTSGAGGSGQVSSTSNSVLVLLSISIPEAFLTVTDDAGNIIYTNTVLTDSQIRLPVGTYNFKFEANGYNTELITRTITSDTVMEVTLHSEAINLLWIAVIIVIPIALLFVFYQIRRRERAI